MSDFDKFSRRDFLKTVSTTAVTGAILSGGNTSNAKESLPLKKTKTDDNGSRWLRGNMHTHTYWSDGDEFPEMAARWYKNHGYDFLVHTDHNIILKGEKWKTLPAEHESIIACRAAFGADWLETKPDNKKGNVQVKLKTLEQYRQLLEESEEFLLIMGEEVTSPHSVHFNAFYVDDVIDQAQEYGEDERLPLMRSDMRRISKYAQKCGRDTFPVLNHPNWRSAITAEMISETDSLKFFEVYNGIKDCHSTGPAPRHSTDAMWDAALTLRLSRGHKTPLYGLATDDAHNYRGGSHAPGRGWVMVRSDRLEPKAILKAMHKGDFYATTGVILKDIKSNGKSISIEIEPQPGIEYTVEYVGSRRGADLSSKPTLDEQGNRIKNTTRTYSPEVGEVFYKTNDLKSTYKFSGNELYVRVRIKSNAPHIDPISGKHLSPLNYDTQRAWCQPVILDS